MNCRFINLKAISKSILKTTFFLSRGHSIKQQKTCEAGSAPILVPGQGHFVTSHLGDNLASVTRATKVSTIWVDQFDQLPDIFKEVSIFVVWLGCVGSPEIGRRNGIENQS